MPHVEGVDDEVIIAALVTLSLGLFLMNQIFCYLATFFDSRETLTRPTDTFPRQRYGDDENCPICLSSLRLRCQTNCSHSFCAPCIIEYIRSRRNREPFQWLQSMPCPCCRQHVGFDMCMHPDRLPPTLFYVVRCRSTSFMHFLQMLRIHQLTHYTWPMDSQNTMINLPGQWDRYDRIFQFVSYRINCNSV
jgi:hypothetical protein